MRIKRLSVYMEARGHTGRTREGAGSNPFGFKSRRSRQTSIAPVHGARCVPDPPPERLTPDSALTAHGEPQGGDRDHSAGQLPCSR